MKSRKRRRLLRGWGVKVLKFDTRQKTSGTREFDLRITSGVNESLDPPNTDFYNKTPAKNLNFTQMKAVVKNQNFPHCRNGSGKNKVKCDISALKSEANGKQKLSYFQTQRKMILLTCKEQQLHLWLLAKIFYPFTCDMILCRYVSFTCRENKHRKVVELQLKKTH